MFKYTIYILIYIKEVQNLGELRKDYILDKWVYYAPGRRARPKELSAAFSEKHKVDYFAPGNEKQTPTEIGRVPDSKGGWKMRWFENKFPALMPEGNSSIIKDNAFFTHSFSYGYHEIIVETPDGEKQLQDFSVKDTAKLLEVYSKRILDLESKENIKYVLVFKNFGMKAGASIVHSHSQVMATSIIPPLVAAKITASNKFVDCPYCKIIEAEKNSPRFCFENDFAIAICPYASFYNYECWIFSKKHLTCFEDFDFEKTAELLHKILSKLKEVNASYCFAIHYSPKDANLHCHIAVTPQIATWGGFERGGGFVINTVTPEDAAKFYQGQE